MAHPFLKKGVLELPEAKKTVNVTQVLAGGSDIEDSQGRDLLLKKVDTRNELPTVGESDGDSYLILDEDIIVEWDAETSEWSSPKASVAGWLPPVATYNDIATTYPNAADGDTVLVLDEFTFYSLKATVWSVPSAYPKGFTSGCRLKYANGSTITVSRGVIEILGKFVQRTTDLTVTWANVQSGVTEQNSTWYYVYLTVSSTDPTQFEAFISTTVPTKDQYGNTVSADNASAKYHPTLPARFVGSFRNGADGNIVKFAINGNVVTYIGGGIQYILNAGNARTKAAVNVRARVPMTSNSINLYYEMGAGTNTRYVGDSVDWILKVASACAGVVPSFPVTNDSVYYLCSGTNVVSLAIHGYIEDI